MTKTDRNKLKKGNLVIVWWEDIVEDINDEFEKVRTATCRSVGWVHSIREKNKIESLLTVTSEYTDTEHEGNGTASVIPLDCIWKVEKIK